MSSQPSKARAVSVSIYTTDLARSRAFYVEALGFGVTLEHEAFIKLGEDPTLVLCPVPESAPTPPYPSGAVIGVPVEDLDVALDRVRSMGHEVLHQEPEPFPWGRFAAVRDPDGNAVELLEFD